jgi:hypothetical protein
MLIGVTDGHRGKICYLISCAFRNVNDDVRRYQP